MPKLNMTRTINISKAQGAPVNQKNNHKKLATNNENMKERYYQLKSELPETPNSKYKYKQVARDLKESEKRGFAAAVKLTFSRIITLPKKVHWRLILDVADLAKRESRF